MTALTRRCNLPLLNQRMAKRVTKKSNREFLDTLKAWRSANMLPQ